MNICIVALYSFLNDSYELKGRLGGIISAFGLEKHSFTIITTDFNHRKKCHRNNPPASINGVNCVYIPVNKYTRNLSFKRIYSHLQFAKGVKQYLKDTTTKFDLIYNFVPSSAAVLACRDYKQKVGSKVVIDVLDLWPDSLLPIIPIKWVTKFLLYPWYKLTYNSYKLADYISAESLEYAKVAHSINPNVPWSYTYLGVDSTEVSKLIASSNISIDKSEDTIRLCYGGNLGNSYDFNAIIDALILLQQKNIKYKMYFVGGGDKYNYLKEQIDTHKLNAEITGFVSYADYLKYLSECDIAFNSFRSNTKVIHSYKFNDYCATNLFIMNSLAGETSDVINTYKIGINYNNNLPDTLLDICQNWYGKYEYWKQNNKKCVNDLLESTKIYNTLCEKIYQSINGI